jgi:hypothetical protein
MTALLIISAVLGVGILLVIRGTIFKTLWGGFTCDQCGLETDKWNRPISKKSTTGSQLSLPLRPAIRYAA